MSPPIFTPDGSEVSEIVLPDGSTASQVIGPDGNVVFEAPPDIPDSVVYQINSKELTGFNDGDEVQTRPDLVGTADATGTATYRASGLNGFPTVDYDGVDDKHSVTGPTISQPFAIIAVVDGDFSDGALNHWILSNEGDGSSIMAYSLYWRIGAASKLTGTNDSSVNVLTGIYDGASSAIREDGSQTNSGDIGTDGFQIGGLSQLIAAFGGRQFDGDIPFLEVHDSIPSDIASREQDVAAKFGLSI